MGYIQATSNNSVFDNTNKSEICLEKARFDDFMTKQDHQFTPEEEPPNNNNNQLLHNSGGFIIENNNMLNPNWTNSVNSPDIQTAEVIFSNEIIGNYVVKEELNNSLEVTQSNKMQMQDADVKPKLRLDFTNILPLSTTSIDTPEVIRNALSLDQDEFNLVNFINSVSFFFNI